MFKCLLFACFIAISYATVGEKCETEVNCSAGECCEKPNQILILSRRQALVNPIDLQKQLTVGTCQTYKALNESCGIFEKLNGRCSCGPGLQCSGYQVPIDETERSVVAPEPGFQWVYQCQVVKEQILP